MYCPMQTDERDRDIILDLTQWNREGQSRRISQQ